MWATRNICDGAKRRVMSCRARATPSRDPFAMACKATADPAIGAATRREDHVHCDESFSDKEGLGGRIREGLAQPRNLSRPRSRLRRVSSAQGAGGRGPYALRLAYHLAEQSRLR